jgi:glycosyltransferase involved in cell wall biosynthesis
MKIGFDAKRAFQNFTGLGNYSRTLIETLAHYHPNHEYHLFAPRDTDNSRLDAIKRTPSVFPHFPNRIFKKIAPVWRSYFIKNDIEKIGLDIYHGLSHELPLSVPEGVKTVVTIHDLIHERYPEFYPFFDRKMYSFKFKRACEQADLIVAISEQTKRDIIDFYKIPAEKIKVIYQSCDRQFYIDKPQYSPTEIVEKRKIYFQNPKAEHSILYVGSIIPRKNLLNLVKTVALLADLNVQLIVVGNGSGAYFNQIMQHIEQNNMTDWVRFFPNIPFSDLPFLYQNVDALVYPSFFEGFGIPIIEAMWSGCPVVTSEGGCFREAGGDAAFYIDPHKPDSMAHVLRNILINKYLCDMASEKGYAHVAQFHEEKIGQMWIDTYSSLLK